jgi:hypothetical protein
MTYWSPKADLQAFKVSLKRFSACAFLPATFHSPAKRFADERESLLLGPVQIGVQKGGMKWVRGNGESEGYEAYLARLLWGAWDEVRWDLIALEPMRALSSALKHLK